MHTSYPTVNETVFFECPEHASVMENAETGTVVTISSSSQIHSIRVLHIRCHCQRAGSRYIDDDLLKVNYSTPSLIMKIEHQSASKLW